MRQGFVDSGNNVLITRGAGRATLLASKAARPRQLLAVARSPPGDSAKQQEVRCTLQIHSLIYFYQINK